MSPISDLGLILKMIRCKWVMKHKIEILFVDYSILDNQRIDYGLLLVDDSDAEGAPSRGWLAGGWTQGRDDEKVEGAARR